MTSADFSASGYQATLRELRQRLRLAQIAIFRQNSQAIIVLEGYDAAGKGGVIRELSYAWDPRGFAVHPIGPPSKERGRSSISVAFLESTSCTWPDRNF